MRIGPYEVVRELGRGGMGVVHLAHDAALDRPVVIKVLVAEAFAGAEEIGRLRHEAQAAARLRHPGIVGIHALGVHEGRPYIVMDLVEGESLRKRLDRGPLPARHAAHVAAQLARALEHAHLREVLHRDLEPANVLLDRRGDPVLVDFGLTRILDRATRPTGSGTVMGAPSYMSPEQATGSAEVGPGADVYSLGATLYEMLTATPPFTGRSPLEILERVTTAPVTPPSRIRGGIDPALEGICLRCLSKDPRQRFERAGALAEALEDWLRQRAPRTRGSLVAIAAAALMGLGAGAAAAAAVRREAAPDAAPALRTELAAVTSRASGDLRALADAVVATSRLNTDDALESLDRVARAHPDDPAVLTARAWVLLTSRAAGRRDVLERARRDLQRADAVRGDRPTTKLGLMRAYVGLGREAEAQHAAAQLEALQPLPGADDAERIAFLARCALDANAPPTETVRLFSTAVGADPSCPHAQRVRASFHLAQNTLNEAEIEDALIKAFARDPRSFEGWDQLAALGLRGSSGETKRFEALHRFAVNVRKLMERQGELEVR